MLIPERHQDGTTAGNGDIRKVLVMRCHVGLIQREGNGDGMLKINGMLNIGIITHGLHGTHLGKISTRHLGIRRGGPMRETSKTIISYYQGAYGSTIRIDVKTKEWLEYFKQKVIKLLEGDIQVIRFECMYDVDISDNLSIILEKVQRERYPKVSMQYKEETPCCFTWSQDTEELITIIGLVDGLLDGCASGHQYLSNEGDNILVVLVFNE